MADEADYLENDIYGAIQFGEFGKYLRNKRIKTQFQHQQRKVDDQLVAGEKAVPQILKGVRIHINGQTQMPYQTLVDTIVRYGGESHPVLDRKSLITHIIASNLTPKKFQEFSNYKVITEDWITDSIEAGHLLHWAEYRLKPEGHSTATQADALFDGQRPGGDNVQQLNLLNLRQPDPSAATLSRKRGLTQVDEEHKAKKPKADKPTTPKKQGPISTDLTNEKSPYLPDRISHRAPTLLQDEAWRLKNTAIAPDFIEGYYKSSRLHHLSNWKANLQFLVARLITELIDEGAIAKDNALLAKPTHEFKGTPADNRIIAHVDFDAFFVGVGLKSRPDLIGKPIAVCHSKGMDGDGSTSEIASCSYEARASGVKAGMSLGKARQLCPEIQAMPYDFELYSSISEQFYKILLAHADHLQAVSVDEAYIDISSKVSLDQRYDKPMPLVYVEALRKKLIDATGVDVSIGISYNMVLARLATKKAKPAGSFYLAPGTTSDQEIKEFLLPLDVQELPGIGYSLANKLREMGVETLGEARAKGLHRLQQCLGAGNGQKVLNFAKGIDPRPLEPPGPRQSVSVELNYAIRMRSDEEVEAILVQIFFNRLCAHLAERMKEIKVTSRKMTIKIMRKAPHAEEETTYKFMGHGVVDTFNATQDLPSATDDGETFAQVALRLLKPMHIPPNELRGIGIMMQKLEGFGAQDLTVDKGQRKLDFSVAKPSSRPEKKTTMVQGTSSSDVVAIDLLPPPPAAQRKRSRSPSDDLPPAKRTRETKSAAPAKQPTLNLARTKVTKEEKSKKKKGPANVQTKIGATFELDFVTANYKPLVRGKVSDQQLVDSGIDPSVYHSLPISYQADALTMANEQRKKNLLEEARQKLKYQNLKATSSVVEIEDVIDILEQPIPPLPTFHKLTSLDDIQDEIDKWVEATKAYKGPARQDLARISKFVLACCEDGTRGADLERVTAVLQWWKWAIQERCQSTRSHWMQAWDSVKLSVDEVLGCSLVC